MDKDIFAMMKKQRYADTKRKILFNVEGEDGAYMSQGDGVIQIVMNFF
jgi:hypothetical protein